MVNFTLNVQVRSDLGKGTSRHPCRDAGLVLTIVYSGDKEFQPTALELCEIAKLLENEAAFSHVVALNIDGAKETVLIKTLRRRPVKGFMMHAGFLHVVTDHKLTVHVPLYFINEEVVADVKQSGGEISHTISEVEISCLPKGLPKSTEIDMTKVGLDQIVHLSDLKAPKSIELVQLTYGNDLVVVDIHAFCVVKKEDSEEGAAE